MPDVVTVTDTETPPAPDTTVTTVNVEAPAPEVAHIETPETPRNLSESVQEVREIELQTMADAINIMVSLSQEQRAATAQILDLVGRVEAATDRVEAHREAIGGEVERIRGIGLETHRDAPIDRLETTEPAPDIEKDRRHFGGPGF